MADNLGKISAQRAPHDNIALPAAPDPRVLLASIVHDFNTLLTPIVLVLEEMQGPGIETERHRQKIDGAIYCAFCAKSLARQLLDFASPRPVNLAPVDVGRLVERLEAPLASLLSTPIRLDLDIAENLPKAFIDQELIERALFNLALNARDAMPAGGRVTIAAAQDYPSSSRGRGGAPMIRLSISDSGIGMDEPTLKMAGELHFTTKPHGTGLGLATARQLMERQRGGLSIASVPHRGTTVDLWLQVTRTRYRPNAGSTVPLAGERYNQDVHGGGIGLHGRRIGPTRDPSKL